MLGHGDGDTESAFIPRSSPAHSKAVAKAKHPQPLLGQLEHLDHPDHLPGLQQPPPPSPGLSILRGHPRGTETRAARHSLGDGSEEGQGTLGCLLYELQAQDGCWGPGISSIILPVCFAHTPETPAPVQGGYIVLEDFSLSHSNVYTAQENTGLDMVQD